MNSPLNFYMDSIVCTALPTTCGNNMVTEPHSFSGDFNWAPSPFYLQRVAIFDGLLMAAHAGVVSRALTG